MSINVHQDNQQCTLHKGAEQNFSKSSSILPGLSKCIKRVFKVYFRYLKFHHAETKKHIYQVKILMGYSFQDRRLLWVGGCVLGETYNGLLLWRIEYICGPLNKITSYIFQNTHSFWA